MNNQVIRGTPTIDNPDGIQFVPRQVAIDTGIGGRSGIGVGSDGATVNGPVAEFIRLRPTIEDAERGVGHYYYQPLTNAEKLSLAADTPVGTRVEVSDWEAAGLSQAKQKLVAPSIVQGGVFVEGGTQDGIWYVGGFSSGKRWYNILGVVSGPTDAQSLVWDGGMSRWVLYDNAASPFYYSLSDVDTPNLASNWKKVSDDTAAPLIFTSFSQGELKAGVILNGAGTEVANGVYPIAADPLTFFQAGIQAYRKIGGENNDVMGNGIIFSDIDVLYHYTKNGPFAWQGDNLILESGVNPVPEISRSDIANEENWQAA